MTDDKIREVLDRYERTLLDEPRVWSRPRPTTTETFRHLSKVMVPMMRAMQTEIAAASDRIETAPLTEVPGMADANRARREKLMRWLGFMQGVFWLAGVYTIDEMRAHNKPDDEPFRDRDDS